MSVRLLSIVPGKPMYTSTKEFRPQSQKSCYQKTFWGWHTQYTQSRSPFSGPKDPQIACYLAATPLSDAMVFYAMGIFRFCSRKAEGSLHRAEYVFVLGMYWKYEKAFFHNYQFWDEIWHLGGQIKHKCRSKWKSSIFIQLSQFIMLRWDQPYEGSDQA